MNYNYHLEQSYGKSSIILQLILNDRRTIVHELLYDCTWLDVVIVWYNVFNADLCHGFQWFTINWMFSYIRTMAVWLSLCLCYEQEYDYSRSIIWLTKINDDSEKIYDDL